MTRAESEAVPSRVLHIAGSTRRPRPRMEARGWTRHAELPGDVGDISVIRPSGDGGLRIGGHGGLAVIDRDGRLLAREFVGRHVTALVEAGERVWVGLWNDGVATRDGDRWLVAGTDLGLPGKNLSALAVDRSGMLWLGYYDAGGARIAVTEMLDAMTRRR